MAVYFPPEGYMGGISGLEKLVPMMLYLYENRFSPEAREKQAMMDDPSKWWDSNRGQFRKGTPGHLKREARREGVYYNPDQRNQWWFGGGAPQGYMPFQSMGMGSPWDPMALWQTTQGMAPPPSVWRNIDQYEDGGPVKSKKGTGVKKTGTPLDIWLEIMRLDRGEVPIIAHEGEVILNKEAVDALGGPQQADALNNLKPENRKWDETPYQDMWGNWIQGRMLPPEQPRRMQDGGIIENVMNAYRYGPQNFWWMLTGQGVPAGHGLEGLMPKQPSEMQGPPKPQTSSRQTPPPQAPAPPQQQTFVNPNIPESELMSLFGGDMGMNQPQLQQLFEQQMMNPAFRRAMEARNRGYQEGGIAVHEPTESEISSYVAANPGITPEQARQQLLALNFYKLMGQGTQEATSPYQVNKFESAEAARQFIGNLMQPYRSIPDQAAQAMEQTRKNEQAQAVGQDLGNTKMRPPAPVPYAGQQLSLSPMDMQAITEYMVNNLLVNQPMTPGYGGQTGQQRPPLASQAAPPPQTPSPRPTTGTSRTNTRVAPPPPEIQKVFAGQPQTIDWQNIGQQDPFTAMSILQQYANARGAGPQGILQPSQTDPYTARFGELMQLYGGGIGAKSGMATARTQEVEADVAEATKDVAMKMPGAKLANLEAQTQHFLGLAKAGVGSYKDLVEIRNIMIDNSKDAAIEARNMWQNAKGADRNTLGKTYFKQWLRWQMLLSPVIMGMKPAELMEQSFVKDPIFGPAKYLLDEADVSTIQAEVMAELAPLMGGGGSPDLNWVAE